MAKRKEKASKLWHPHMLERSISAVIRNNDITELDNYTYKFLVQHMGFIAHYDLDGFRARYANVDEFRKALRSGEGQGDSNFMLEWARRYESDPAYAKESSPEYVKSVAEGIRTIVHVARTAMYQPPLLSALDVALAKKNRRAIP